MSKASTLAKLQTLLERVRARSSMPRNGVVGPAVAAAAAPEVAVAPAAIPAPRAPVVAPVPAPPAPAVAPPAAIATRSAPSVPEPPLLLDDGAPTLPPPPAAAEDVAVEEISVEIEVGEPESAPPAPVVAAAPVASQRPEPLPFESVAPPPAPPTPEGASPAASESAERLVAADRVPSEPPVAIVAPPPAPEPPPAPIEASAPPPASIEPEVDLAPLPVEEAPAIPAAPASSRRPVAPEPEEHLAEMAFGSEEPVQPPRHTPPPESGRLPAGPVEEFDADVTGVRNAPHAEVARASEVEAPLAPVEIRAPMPSAEAVGEIVGAPPPFEPATFAAWLEATLGL